MALLIDGYNLLHASGILPRGLGPSTLERARNALLNFLVESLDAAELAKAVVVFDARAAPKGRPRVVTHRGLRVHFAPNPGDADALIEELIARDHSPRQLVVVSSDHRLQRAAKRRKAQPVDSDRWYHEVVQRRAARHHAGGPDEAAKPAGPLSPGEVTRWLSQFGMAPVAEGTGEPADLSIDDLAEEETAEDEAPNADAAGPEADKKAGQPRRKRPAKKRPRPANPLNPFPPGYGEDLLDER